MKKMKDFYLINSEGKGSLDSNSHYEHHNQHPWNGIGEGNTKTSSASPSSSSISVDDEYCPQCGTQYNTSNFRILTEICGHSKCRRCLITSEDGCTECSLNSARPTSTSSPGSISNDKVASGRPVQSTSVYSDSGASEPEYCPQCGTQYNTSNYRKVTESCGHSKCRRCIIMSEDGCKECTHGDFMERDDPPFNNHFEVQHPQQSSWGRQQQNHLQQQQIAHQQQNNRTVTTRRTTAAARLQSATNSRANSLNSGRPVMSGGGGVVEVVNDGYAATIDFDTMVASPSSSGFLDFNPADSKCFPSILDEESDFSKGLMSLRKMSEVINNNSSSNSAGNGVPSTSVNCNPSLTFSATKESSTSSISSLSDDNRDEAGSPKPSTSTGGPTGLLRSTDDESSKKKKSPLVIPDHITLLGGHPLMYQCNICNKKFKTKANIKYHEFCKGKDKPFKCETCGKGFITRGQVTRHMRSHTEETPFVCPECDRGFANAQALRSHTLIHTGERPFVCTYCNERFTGRTNLKKHVITHTGERPFSCPHCGKSFALKWTLDLHLRTHSSERPYACDQCSRAFSNSTLLRRHLVIHSGENPFKCWICNTAFRRKDNLEQHIDKIHNQSKEVAKQLANEAAAEYLKTTLNNQNISIIPVSRVNSVVISNIIKNNNLMPANVPTSNRANQKVAGSSNAPGTSASSMPSKTPRKKGGKSAMSPEKEDYPTLPQDNLKRGRPSRNKQNVEERPSTSSAGAEETFTPTPQS